MESNIAFRLVTCGDTYEELQREDDDEDDDDDEDEDDEGDHMVPPIGPTTNSLGRITTERKIMVMVMGECMMSNIHHQCLEHEHNKFKKKISECY